MKFKSHAEWPKEAGIRFSDDTHTTMEEAQGVCDNLTRDGFGGNGKIFPIRTWITDENNEVEYYTVYCATGCSCCNSENHYRGPFSSRAIAEQRVAKYREIVVLASQYSRKGNYTIYGPYKGEVLPDGRIVGGGVVYDGWADDKTPGGEDEKTPD